MHPLTKPSSFLFALSFLFAPSDVSAHRNLPRKPQRHPHLDERLMPITATTTVVVQRTATHTVWVQPTNQLPVALPGLGGGSGSDNEDQSSSSTSVEASTSSIVANSSAHASSTHPTSSITPSSSSSSASHTSSSSTSSEWDTASPTSSYSELASASASASASTSESGEESPIPSSTYLADSPSISLTSSLASSTIDASSSYLSSSSIYSSDFPTASPSLSASASASASTLWSDYDSSITDSQHTSSSHSGSKSASTSLSSSSTKGSSSTSSSISAFASSTASATASETASITAGETISITASETASVTISETASETISLTAGETASLTLNETEAITSTHSSHLTASSTSYPNITSTLTSDFASSTSSNITSFEPSGTVSLNISATASVTSTSSAASATSTGLREIGSTIMAAYYPDWAATHLPPESVDWNRFDVVDFAFALPTSDNNIEFTQDDSVDLLNRLVTAAHTNGKRVKLSIGGWTGSQYFSTICGNSWSRSTFVQNILSAYNSYNLDGIDIDWEYPGTTGADGNAISSNDSANFLLFLQELRAALPTGALITTATQVWPFADSNGSPMSDVSEFAKVIDWILIMNYDVWGSSTTPGPNAPLSDACGNSTQPLANAYAAVSSWTGAGMPANQITLGVPAYGYLQKSTASSLKQRRRSSFPLPPHKNSNDSRIANRASDVTIYNDWGGSSDGQIMFDSLVEQGALKLQDGEYVGSGGFTRHWDSCSSTPWLKSSSSGQIITYDDTQSMNLKGQFAAQVGLRGCNVFSIDGDWTGSSWPLTDSVRSGLGL
ncbi:hypothetical protein I302_108279 [Kwoniella bestiolae CBS 10118]|uniref:GH18 domain-containing protein n=1 Tax=Kwoniella bestiolae CBS 10118 TaxID=1296100 RepID=A0A1B9FW62_9TREE|nr:hypothetical protein I302_07353 [Kwoniella bestiolae CBS 10118]OCF23003.1 hypothetical protein I302_07353 [Kwoniella bestiolae CBS 10118]